MKSDRKILFAFLLNLFFSVFELIGGTVTGSVAIISDSLHDLGDAAGISVSWYLEKKSKKRPDHRYTYGYSRYSVLGGMLTSVILLLGSLVVIYNAVHRLLHPSPIHYDGMILLAVIGTVINLAAALLTHGGKSLNQKAINLHMLEDVLGWLVVLIGAVVMRFTDLAFLDPVLSIAVAVFIVVNASRTLKETLDLFLEKIPHGVSVEEVRSLLCGMEQIRDVHHIHIWSLDGQQVYATMHIVTDADPHTVKEQVRQTLYHHGVHHATLELEAEGEPCTEPHCHTAPTHAHLHHHHHH